MAKPKQTKPSDANYRLIPATVPQPSEPSLPPNIWLADPAQRKAVFAENLNQLMDLISGNRKVGSEQIGISYRWVRRMVSAGISRPDERNQVTLAQIAEFFALPNANLLWRNDLVPWLLTAEHGRDFVAKFGDRIAKVVNEQIAQTRTINKALVEAWTATQGGQQPANQQSHQPDHESKLAALVRTGKHDVLKQLDAACKRLVDEAYEKEFGGDRDKRSGTA